MKVSIITVCFNSAETIEDTVKSVLGQDYPEIEYIIVDGDSRDNTLEVIEPYRSKIAKLVSEPDKGIYDAMNKGVAMASGYIIGILNSDDVYADSKVINDVVRLFQQTACDACYADLCYVQRNDLSQIVRYWKSGEYKRANFMKGWMPPHPTFFLTKAAYQQYGLYNLQFRTSADYELMLRMLYKHELSCAYLPRTIISMRVGGQSNLSLKNRLRANREDRMAWKLNDLKPGIFTTIRKPLSKISQFFKK